MKKYIFTMTFLLIVLSLVSCSAKETGEVIVETKVGSITEEKLMDELHKRYGKDVLEELVTIEVLSEKYDVDEKQVDDEMEKLKSEYGTQFDLILQQQGFKDEESFKSLVYLGMLRDAAALDEVEITESELKELYERKTKEISAQHILVTDEDVAADVIEQLDNGADFSELAKEFSEDAINADEGGDLGYFSGGKMVPIFEDAAFSMEPNEISQPIETNHGYHIIKVNDVRKKDNEKRTFEEMEDSLREEIIGNIVNTEETQIKIDKMIQEAIVDVKDSVYKSLFGDAEDSTS